MGAGALVIATVYNRLSTIREALHDVGWQVSTFQNPKEALDSLTSQHYSAVFCDSRLRGASAGGFLAWTRRVSPQVPFYLFGEADDSALMKRTGGPTAQLSFPPVSAELPRPAHTPAPSSETAQPPGLLKVPLSGNSSLVPISGLLEMLGIAKQSAVIALTTGRESGAIYLEQGIVTHAEVRKSGGASVGLGALAHFMLLDDYDFRVLSEGRPKRPTISLPAATALTEAARLADEQQRGRRLLTQIAHACPSLNAAATGYLLAAAPTVSQGEGAEALFALAQDLLDKERVKLDGRVRELFLATDSSAVACGLFGDDNLLAARAPAAGRGKLYNAVRGALRSEP